MASAKREHTGGREAGQSTEVCGMLEFRMIQAIGSRQRDHSFSSRTDPGSWILGQSSCSVMTF